MNFNQSGLTADTSQRADDDARSSATTIRHRPAPDDGNRTAIDPEDVAR